MGVRRLVVVGASLAGLRAVEAARRAGYSDRITLIGDEPHLPYDRPPLSKALLAEGPEPPDPTFRTLDHLVGELGVDLQLGTRAEALDVANRAVVCADREFGYDALVVATGSTARHLDGTHRLAGIRTLRTLDDARAVRAALNAASRVVVAGAGFIGAEVASAAKARGLSVTIVEAAPVPLIRAFGEEMGLVCSSLHDRNGVELRTGVQVQGFEGSGHVEKVLLSDGSRISADLVVVGIGADPAVEWLEPADLDLELGITCDATLATSAPGVYAAGDVARWHNPVFGQSMRLESWTSAAEQGAVAARNALGREEPKAYATVPYNWTDWYGSRIQFVGRPTADEVRVVLGGPDEDRLVAIYRRGDRLAGALAISSSSVVMKYRIMIGKNTSWQDALDFSAARLSAVRTT